MSQVFGGQLWQQPAFPNCRRYVIYLPNGRFAMAMPPVDGQGSLICTVENRRWQWTGEELKARFRKFRYVNRGQYRAAHFDDLDTPHLWKNLKRRAVRARPTEQETR